MIQLQRSTYTFERSFPSGTTAEDAYYASDLRRAIECYKVFLPTVSSEAVMQQIASIGGQLNKVGMVMATSPKQEFGGPNSDTPYAIIVLDLTVGPIVVDIPANPLLLGPGPLNKARQTN